MSYTSTKPSGLESNPLVVIDIASLKAIIGHVVENALASLKLENRPEPNNDDNDLMNMEEVLTFLKVSKVTIHNWKRKGIIKSHKIGRKLYFKRTELSDALKRQKYSILN